MVLVVDKKVVVVVVVVVAAVVKVLLSALQLIQNELVTLTDRRTDKPSRWIDQRMGRRTQPLMSS